MQRNDPKMQRLMQQCKNARQVRGHDLADACLMPILFSKQKADSVPRYWLLAVAHLAPMANEAPSGWQCAGAEHDTMVITIFVIAPVMNLRPCESGYWAKLDARIAVLWGAFSRSRDPNDCRVSASRRRSAGHHAQFSRSRKRL